MPILNTMPLTKQSIANNKQNTKNILNKKYFCSTHNRAFRDKSLLTLHMNSKFHVPKPLRPVKLFMCAKCKFSSKYKQSYNKHLKTKKHLK